MVYILPHALYHHSLHNTLNLRPCHRQDIPKRRQSHTLEHYRVCVQALDTYPRLFYVNAGLDVSYYRVICVDPTSMSWKLQMTESEIVVPIEVFAVQ